MKSTPDTYSTPVLGSGGSLTRVLRSRRPGSGRLRSGAELYRARARVHRRRFLQCILNK